MQEKSKIALVLGSGGARGLAHIGVLKILEKYNIPIHLIVGTSIGAFVGAFYAAGIKLSIMEELALSTDKKFVAKMLLPSISTSGFIDGEQIKNYLKIYLGEKKIENLNIPFIAVATDITTGEEILHTKGPVVDAILTSIAIPGLFKPVLYKQKYLVDGGLVNPLPVSVAKQAGATIVIAVNVTPEPGQFISKKENILYSRINRKFTEIKNKFKILERIKVNSNKKQNDKFLKEYPTLFQTLRQSLSIMENKILEINLKNHPPDVLIKPDVNKYDLLAFYKAKEIITAGEIAALDKLNLITKLLKKAKL